LILVKLPIQIKTRSNYLLRKKFAIGCLTTSSKNRSYEMTIQEFLEWMDGNGIIITNLDLVEEVLKDEGYFLDNTISLDVEKYQED
jgi:hypothetical protein